MSQITAVRVWVYGRVQGVGFRYSIRYQALQLGLTGYAGNLEDGGVELVACGEQQQVQRLLDWLSSGGPPAARIEKQICQHCLPDEQFSGFSIRY